jgi:ABC-2 type transport system permease protein
MTTVSERITGLPKFFVDIKFLFLEQILEVRYSWYIYLVFSVILPVTMVFGFARLGGQRTDTEGLIYIICGSAIFAVASDGLYMLALRIGSMKKDGMLLYYASLPISKAAFLIAIVLSRLTVVLPAMLLPIIFGAWFYDLPLHFNLWILVVLPLTALSLSVIGMAIGAFIDNIEVTQILVNVLLLVMVMAAPVFTPMQALPLPLQILGYFLPPTYAAAALRAAITGSFDLSLYGNLAMLGIMTFISFVVANRYLRWQLR